MNGTKIVTGIVLLSLSSVGCRAKFTTKSAPYAPASGASFAGPVPPPATTGTVPSTPAATPTAGRPVDLPPIPDSVPEGPMVPQVRVPPTGNTVPHPGVGQPTIPSPTARPQIACPTSGDMSVDQGRVIQRKTIVFRQGRQMVWRKNCDGRVYSKQYEEFSRSTAQKFVLRPRTCGGPITIVNRTTCDTPSIPALRLSDARDGAFLLSVSIVPAANTLLVKPGRNLIDYEIPGGERGTLILTVKISNNDGGCVVLNDRGCEPKRPRSWTDDIFAIGQ